MRKPYAIIRFPYARPGDARGEDRHLQHQRHQGARRGADSTGCDEPSPTSCSCRRSSRPTRASRATRDRGLGYNVETHGRKASTASRSCRSRRSRTCARPARRRQRRAGALDRGAVVGPRACGSAGSTCRTATRRRGRSTTTSSPGWNGCARAAALLRARRPRSYCGRLQRHSAGRGRDETRGLARTTRCSCPQTRAAFRRLLNLGFTDALRAGRPRPGLYTFWDYQAGAWQRDNGIRIDHLLLSPQAADLLKEAADRRARSRAGTSRRTMCRCGSNLMPEAVASREERW